MCRRVTKRFINDPSNRACIFRRCSGNTRSHTTKEIFLASITHLLSIRNLTKNPRSHFNTFRLNKLVIYDKLNAIQIMIVRGMRVCIFLFSLSLFLRYIFAVCQTSKRSAFVVRIKRNLCSLLRVL